MLDVLGMAFRHGAAGRSGLDVLPCFKIRYADGHEMATLGVCLGGKKESSDLQRLRNDGFQYMVSSFNDAPVSIDVPVLTRKERLYLESKMPSSDYRRASYTGVGKQDFVNFSKVYRFMPSYAELLLG